MGKGLKTFLWLILVLISPLVLVSAFMLLSNVLGAIGLLWLLITNPNYSGPMP